MVISEKQVADQLKALNIGFNPKKEQIEETLTYIDTIRVNQPNLYTKYKEDIFDPYETKVRDLEAEYGAFKRGIVLQTADAEKALQQIVDRSIQEGKNPNIDDATREAAKKSVENIKQGYTERMLPTFNVRIQAVKENLATGDDRAQKLLELLEAVLKNATSASVNALQNEMLSGRTGVTVSKKWDPDGYFGPLTMNALEKIPGVKAEEAVAETMKDEAKTGISKQKLQTKASTIDVLKSKTVAAGTAVSQTVSSAVSSIEKKFDSNSVSAQNESKLTPHAGFTLKDGSKVQGMYVKEGRMWFIGAKGERQEINPALLPDGITTKKIEAINENAKKLALLASDAELLLQATANHARIAHWSNSKSWENKLSEFAAMLQTLDISNETQARRAIILFIQGAPSAKGDLAKEFADVFNFVDNDAERHAKVYKYIRWTWYNLGVSGAGFDGGSELLSNRIASAELLKKNVGPKELEAFVAQWMNGNWSNASDDAVSKAIVQSAKNAGGAFQYLATVYNNEKWLPGFVKSFKSSIKQLNEAYKDPKIDTELAKVIKTENEREVYKRESRNAKLMTLLGTTALAQHLKNKPQERTGNFELDTFGSIHGTDTIEISDKTAMYIRNDLKWDIAIEVAAIGAGAVTAGFGTAAIHGLAAARWAARAGEMARIGTRVTETGKLTLNGAGKAMTRVVGGGAGFELGHGAVSGVVRGKDFGEWYSTDAFLQSMAFAGAFEAANKILKLEFIAKRFGVTEFDPATPLYKQKALLGKYVIADVLASLGVSCGISWKQGEDYTFQEAFQAIAMAAFFRTAMTKAGGVPWFRAKKNGKEISVEPVGAKNTPETNPQNVNQAPRTEAEIKQQLEDIKSRVTSMNKKQLAASKTEVAKLKSQLQEIEWKLKSDEASATKALNDISNAKNTQAKTVTLTRNGTDTTFHFPERDDYRKVLDAFEQQREDIQRKILEVQSQIRTADAIMETKPSSFWQRKKEVVAKSQDENIATESIAAKSEENQSNGKSASAEEGSVVQPEKKAKKEKNAENDQKKIYHVLELAEPGYKKFKEKFFGMSLSRRIALMDAAVQEWFLIGKPYWLISSAVKWLTWVMIENIIGGVLKSVTRPVDVFLNVWKTLWKEVKFVDKPLSTWRSLVYADRRTHADFEKATDTWKWRRRADPAALLVLGTAAAFNHESENEYEWFKECLKSLVGGVILTTYRNQEWVHAVTVWKKNNNKTVRIEPTAHFAEEKSPESNPVNPAQGTTVEGVKPTETESKTPVSDNPVTDVPLESESNTPETSDASKSSDVVVNQ